MLGIFQKLVASRVHDQDGFRILEALLDNLPLETLQPYMTEVGLPFSLARNTQNLTQHLGQMPIPHQASSLHQGVNLVPSLK